MKPSMPDRKIILETPRLYLHEMTVLEAADAHELNADPEVIRYTGDPPFKDVAHARQFLLEYPDYRRHGYGRWAVRLKEDDTFLGWCGLKWTDEMGAADIGFRFHQRYWNKGFATESARACIEYGFSSLGSDFIIGRAMHDNKASIRVLEKTGMYYWKEVLCDLHPAVCYRINRP